MLVCFLRTSYSFSPNIKRCRNGLYISSAIYVGDQKYVIKKITNVCYPVTKPEIEKSDLQRLEGESVGPRLKQDASKVPAEGRSSQEII